MSRLTRALVCAVAVASLGAGCAKPQVSVVPVEPVVLLLPPPPPPRIVEPYAVPEVEPPAEPQENAAAEEEPPARPAARPPAPQPSPPATEAAPPRPAGEPGLVLRPPGSDEKAQASIRSLLSRAERDLDRVNYQTLGRDGRVQHDIARRFMQQAESALADGNLMFAGKLADKAASMAAILVR